MYDYAYTESLRISSILITTLCSFLFMKYIWNILMAIIQPFYEWEHLSSRWGTWPMFPMAIPGWWAASMDGCTKRRRPWLRQLKLSSSECASLQVWGCIARTHTHTCILHMLIQYVIRMYTIKSLPVAVACWGIWCCRIFSKADLSHRVWLQTSLAMCWNKLKDTPFTNDADQQQEILNSALHRLF